MKDYNPLDDVPEDETDEALQGLEIQRIMSTQQGRKLVQGILDQCNLDTCIFSADERAHVFNEGKRSIATNIAGMVKTAAPSLYIKMIEEKLNG